MCWHLCSGFISIHSFLHIKHDIVLILFAPAKHCKFFFLIARFLCMSIFEFSGMQASSLEATWCFHTSVAPHKSLAFTARPLVYAHYPPMWLVFQASWQVSYYSWLCPCHLLSLGGSFSPVNLLPLVCCLAAGWTVKETHYLSPCFLLQGPHALHSWKTSVPSHPHSFQWMEFHPYLPTPWTASVVAVVVAVVVVVIICVTFYGY